METKLIYLVRHGETDANLKRIYQGKGQDYPLNDTGREQSKLLGQWMKKFIAKPDVVISSPAKRALDTACILHYELFGQSKKPLLMVVPNLYEINHGTWEGKSDDEVKAEDPELYKVWRKTPMKLEFPSGESMKSAKERIVSEWLKILERDEKRILLIAHGGVNFQILNHALGSNKLRNIWQENTCFNIIEQSKNRLRVRLMNSTAHLMRTPEALR